nr:MAG TPA: hypothetical protein [Caudoviricetes sp.]
MHNYPQIMHKCINIHCTIRACCFVVCGTVCRGWRIIASCRRCKKLHYADNIRRVYADFRTFSAGNGVKSYKPIKF